MCSIKGTHVIEVPKNKPIRAYRICMVGRDYVKRVPYLISQYQIWYGTWKDPTRPFETSSLPPTLQNESGLYARLTRRDVHFRYFNSFDVVVGVDLWGTVVVGTEGAEQLLLRSRVGTVPAALFGLLGDL